ncbi:MAG: relaxase/mobilization nuclease domain-containing protein [Gallionellaceae bacterium]|nr:relaxase/mobilization nuclease domain-containing protein [Gallionellaceae bacterium]
MISKIQKGTGFLGVLDYTMGKNGAEQIGGNMAGETPRQLAAEFGAVRDHSPTCTRPVFHASLSAAPGERLTDEQWQDVGRDYLQNMGFDPDKHQWVMVRHIDREHEHVHLVANRVDPENFRAVSDKNDFRRTQEAVRQAEVQHGLTHTPSGGRNGSQTAPKPFDQGKAAEMRRVIDTSIKNADGNRQKFIENMADQGVAVKLNQASTGHISGVSFQAQEGPAIKGSELGRGYKWQSIQSRLDGKELGPANGKTRGAKPVPVSRLGASGARKSGITDDPTMAIDRMAKIVGQAITKTVIGGARKGLSGAISKAIPKSLGHEM